MSPRNYLFLLMGCLGFGVASVASVNAFVDPLWFFSFVNGYNSHQVGFDERQQKTNRIAFGAFDYDALLLGSSRSTYIDQHAFVDNHVFNYAVSGMRPEEYSPFIAFAESRRGQPFRAIYLGVDFFGSNKNYGGRAAPARQYIENTVHPLYRLEALLSLETLSKSMENIRQSRAECDCYQRDNVKLLPRRNAQVREDARRHDLNVFRRHIYALSYAYDESLPETWLQLVRQLPRSRLIVFTTPISVPLFEVLIESGRWRDFERWMRDMVQAFGEVYDFMGVNVITKNPDNYHDASHFYPAVGTLIAHRLIGAGSVPVDFGILVNKDNLDRHLAELHQAILALSDGRR